ncbi:Family with sequence similarity 21, member [Chamberlinius hualienensis]
MENTSSDFLIYNVNHSETKTTGSNDNSYEQMWDKSWSTDQMRDHSNSWSLAGDSGLLNRLQEIAQNLISQTHLIQKEVNSLSHEAEVTQTVLNNVNSDFLMLSNSQFVESRVYDEEISNDETSLDTNRKDTTQTKSKEAKEAEIISKVSQALKLGISVLHEAYEHFEVQDSDSEDDGETYRHEPILHPKDPYLNRPLPYIIGTELFNKDNKLGIFESFSEDELPDDVSVASSDSTDVVYNDSHLATKSHVLDDIESDVESDVGKPQPNFMEDHENDDIFSPDNDIADKDDIHSNDDGDFFTSTLKSGFDKELAAKIRPPGLDRHNDADASVSPSTILKKSDGDDVSKSGNESILAFPKLQSKSSDSLSGKGFQSDSDDDLFGKDTLFSTKEKKSSLFDSDDFFKPKESAEDGTGKSFESSQSKEKKQDKEAKSSVKKGFRDDMFSDSDADDDDLFSTSRTKKTASQPIANISSDVDSGTKKPPVGGKSIFGLGGSKLNQQLAQHIKGSDIDNEESDNGGSQVSRSTSSASIRDFKRDAISASSSGNLFDDDDDNDLFGASSAAKTKTKNNPNLSIFNDMGDDDFGDIFAPVGSSKSSGTPSETSTTSKTQTHKTITRKADFSILNDSHDDDDDDLFSTNTVKKQTIQKDTESKTVDVKTTINKVEDEAKPSITRTTLTKSLFDDDVENDLFAPEPKKSLQSLSKTKPETSKPSSLFADDDDDFLFGTTSTASPGVNIFGSSSTENSKMKDEKKKTISVSSAGDADVHSSSHESKNLNFVVNIEDKSKDEGLFTVSAEIDKTSSIVKIPPSPNSRTKISKLRSDITDRLENIVSPDVTRRKPPVGGVSMLGGAVPVSALLKAPRSPSPISNAPTESTPPTIVPSSPKFHIGSPGLAPTVISTTEKSVSFDKPAETNLLHNANKDRAKIQIKRRPQTRRARQETIRNSVIDLGHDKTEDNLSISEQQTATVSAPTSPVSSVSNTKQFLTPIPLKSDKLSLDPSKSVSLLSPSTDEDDLFVVDSRQPSIPPSSKVVKTAKVNVSTPKRVSSSDNLFGDSSDDGDAEELFLSKSSRRAKTDKEKITKLSDGNLKNELVAEGNSAKSFKFDGKFDNADDVFGNLSKTSLAPNVQTATDEAQKMNEKSAKAVNSKAKKAKSLFDDDDDDDDLFKSTSNKLKATSADVNNRSSSTKPKSLFDDENDDDLFVDPLMARKK